MDSLCRLDEIVAVVDEKSGPVKNAALPYLGLEHIGQQGAGLVGQAESAASISTNSIFKQGDVLFGKLRPNLRKCVLAPFEGYCSTDVLVLRPNGEVDPRFAARVFQAERVGAEAERTAAGTKMPRTSWKELRALKVFCPDLRSQERRADVMDTLDTTIRQTEAIIEKLKQVKQGLLHDLLTRGIDANGELRPPQSQAPHLYKDSPLGWIPREWQVVPAGQACEAVIDCKNRTPPETTSGHPVIRTPNVRDGRFVRSGLAYTDSHSYSIWTERGRPRKGDVLITREAPVGEVCLLPEDMTDACLGQRMMMYRPDPNVLTSNFMLIALLSSAVQKSLLDLAGGSTVGHVKVGDIRRLRIPVPSVCERGKIVQAYGATEEWLASEQALRAKLKQQKSGLMDDLLTGRVRVTPLLGATHA
jgi:type I restriction enzyme S subunit